MLRHPFKVMRNGDDIRNVPLKEGVSAGISHSMNFLEWEAATAAGLSLWSWEKNEYSKAFKAKVIAWYNLHRLVDAHQQDASMAKGK